MIKFNGSMSFKGDKIVIEKLEIFLGKSKSRPKADLDTWWEESEDYEPDENKPDEDIEDQLNCDFELTEEQKIDALGEDHPHLQG